MSAVDMQESDGRPFSMTSFQRKLDLFDEFISEVTMQDLDVSTEEKRQSINENLRYDDFCENIRAMFGSDVKTEDMKAIFRKISTNPEVKVDWSEVFGYFQSETEEGETTEEVSVFTVSKRKKIGEAAGDKKRRDVIQSISYSPEYDIYVTASQKGALSIYNGKLRLQTCIDTNESAWMTSCLYLPRLRKVIATTERSIVVWDHRAKANNQSSLYIIKPLEHSPQCMCHVPSEDEHVDSVLIGDDAGFVNLVRFTANDFASNTSKDPKRAMMSHIIDPTTLSKPFKRRKVHPDWVLKIEYLPDIKSFASCSPSEKTSFAIVDFKRMFDAPYRELSLMRGVNAFAYSEKSNIFATGGVDKIIRVWHPNILTRPTGKMMGHLFTIIAVVINNKDQHIISLSTARVFRVWDIHTLSCLQVFTDTEQKSGDRRISCMLFDGRHDRLFTGSSSIDMWPMTRTVQDTMAVPHTHDHPVTVIVKNRPMSQVISACSEPVVKVWEVDTGRQMYQIMEAHTVGVEVMSGAVDSTGSRMITGAYDGSVKVWEFSSGQELKSFSLDSHREDDQTVLWIAYVAGETKGEGDDVASVPEGDADVTDENEASVQTQRRRIIAVGWNNKLKEFMDNDNSEELEFVREFDSTYEWPPTPPSSPDQTIETASLTGSVKDDHGKKKMIVEDEPLPRKEDVLLRHEITCCALMDESIESVSKILVTGCSNGNIILWNHHEGTVVNIFELEKAELPSRYDSRRRRMKELYPYRVNAVSGLCHKVFRPDPEELKRRKKLRKKKLQEMEEGENATEGDEGEKEENGSNEDEKSQKEGEDGNDDPAEEADIEVESSVDEEHGDEDVGGEGRQHPLFDFEHEPIKMVEVDYPPVIATGHHDSTVRLWTVDGTLLLSMVPMIKVISPITAMCSDEYASYVIVGDTKGYITMWDVSELLERSPTTTAATNADLVHQVISWRAHLLKITSIAYVDSSAALLTASTDGSVRVWYPQRAHYIGYFGQHRVWYLSPNPSLPSSPVLPYDINEVPVKPVNVKSGRRKPQTKKYDYPLVFDAEKWKPFRRSAYDRDIVNRQQVLPNMVQAPSILEVRNKKFFKALVKPKADKTSLESSKPAEPESGAIFRALPVYRLQTPPPQPTAPSMDLINGGNLGNGDPSSAKTQSKYGTPAKGGKGRPGPKKVSVMSPSTPATASGTTKRRR